MFDIKEIFEEKYANAKNHKIGQMEPGAGICVPPEVCNRVMYCKPTEH